MMKKWITFLTAALMLLGMGAMTACSDDDNSAGSAASTGLVGTWRRDSSCGYQHMTFNSNGNGYFLEIDYEFGNDSDTFYWNYTPSSSDLVLTDDDGHMETYKVLLLTRDQLIIQYYCEFGTDPSETWYRVE